MTVDGALVRHPGLMVDPGRARVALDGQTVRPPREYTYILLHKPPGYLSTRRDPHGRRTVMALLDERLARLVYPVGRLDWDASGLLLLTNDGELANRLLHPRYHVPRTYEVEVTGTPSPEALRELATGVALSEGVTAPAKVKVHKPTRMGAWVKVTLREGRKNQIKRMFAAVGHPVRTLKRVGFGSLHLGHAPPGFSRLLRPAEVHALKEAVGLLEEETEEGSGDGDGGRERTR